MPDDISALINARARTEPQIPVVKGPLFAATPERLRGTRITPGAGRAEAAFPADAIASEGVAVANANALALTATAPKPVRRARREAKRWESEGDCVIEEQPNVEEVDEGAVVAAERVVWR